MNDKNIEISPSIKIDSKELFGVSCEFDIYKFKEKTEHVPDIDQTYIFDPTTTLSILAGFSSNRRVLIQGYHGTGKSCLLYTSPSPRDQVVSRMPSSA